MWLFDSQRAQSEVQTNVSTTASPSLIILCTWLGGATPRRIKKYVDGYRALFPTSSILLVCSGLKQMMFSSFATLHLHLLPARNAIQACIARDAAHKTPSSLLLHCFSTGGCNMGAQLARSMRQDGIDVPKVLQGVVYDCAPGDSSINRVYKAASTSLPASPALVRLVGKSVIAPAVATLIGLSHVGAISGIDQMRVILNDPDTFGKDARRLYMYSKEDDIVYFKAVESHFEEARTEKGYAVDTVTFLEKGHCSLLRLHAKEYWIAIEGFWQRVEHHEELEKSIAVESLRSKL